MSKKIVRSLVFAIAGVLALSLRAEIAWTTSSCSSTNWSALANNLLAGKTGTISGQVATAYSVDDPALLTDGNGSPVGTAGEVKEHIVGFQNGTSVSWSFAEPEMLEQVRISCGYLVANQNYSGFTVSSVEVQAFGSSTWTTLNTEIGQMVDNGQNAIQSLALADGSGVPLAENVGALRVTFGMPPVSYANYCVEIEAVGTASGAEPTYDITITAPQNGTLETSVTNDVTAGTAVTVTATPAEGYQLVSVTTNGAVLAGSTFTMPSEDVTVAATFEETATPPSDDMFYVGDTGYSSWMDAYTNVAAGATIVVGTNAVIDDIDGDHPGVINKSVTIDLNGRDLSFAEGWLTGCTVTLVDNGTPVGSGLFTIQPSGMNISGGTLDLSALSGSQIQVNGKFRMSSKSLLKFPSDLSLDDFTPLITIEKGNDEGKGARIVVQGVTYVYDGTGWGVAFKITSIAVYDEVVEFGVMTSGDGPVTILGSETVNGDYDALKTTKVSEGLYQVPVSTCRFFKAALEMQ